MQPVLALLASHKHKESDMGQFKPMVKMETTEPSVILKLKKGGHVNMKKGGKAEAGHKKMAGGGSAMEMMMGTPALVGRPAVNAPVRAPGKPSMAARRKAMMAKPAMSDPSMAPPPMKKGGKAEGGESKAAHKAEMSAIKGVDKKLTKHASMAASKGHKGLKTGGVVNGQGGYATGGVTKSNGGGYKMGGKTKKMADGGGLLDQIGFKPGMPMPGGGGGGGGGGDASSGLDTVNQGASTIGGALKNIASSVGSGGGGGGRPPPYFDQMMQKRGGKVSKKAYAAGGTVNSGRPVAMPQGAKKPSQPVSTNRQAGTFKKGGKVTPAEGNLMKAFGMENAPAMKSAKAQSNDVYSKYQKMAEGGSPTPDERFFDKNKVDPKSVSDKASRELEEALNPLSMVKELYGKARDAFRGQGSMSDKEKSMPLPTKGAVTKTEKSITVTPAGKRRGGRAC